MPESKEMQNVMLSYVTSGIHRERATRESVEAYVLECEAEMVACAKSRETSLDPIYRMTMEIMQAEYRARLGVLDWVKKAIKDS